MSVPSKYSCVFLLVLANADHALAEVFTVDLPSYTVDAPFLPLDRFAADFLVTAFLAAERLAEIPHIDGRATYGLRRQAVDGSLEEGISSDGLQQQGGWSDKQIPETIYRDQDRTRAAEEARDIRARLRGEQVNAHNSVTPA